MARDNAGARAALERKIAQLRAIPGLPARAAPEVAEALKEEITSNIAAAQAPDGSAWKPKADGSAPLVNAAAVLRVTNLGTRIVASLEGHHARHHFGAVKGKIKREILPSGKVPQPLVRAIEKIMVRELLDG